MKKRFPQYLTSPLQFLWFEIDELGVALLSLFLAAQVSFDVGLIMKMVISLCFMVLAVWGYSTLKKKYPRGFFRHLTYFIGLTNLKGYPSFFEDRFWE